MRRPGGDDAARARASTHRLAERGYEGREGLLRALRDDSVAVRSEAAFLLGLSDDEAARPALREALADASARVRVEAAFALARLGAVEAARELLQEELGGRFFEDAPLRAARALALLGDAAGWPRVLEALASPLPSNRMEAVAALPAFVPFDGRTVDARAVDVRAALRAAAGDPEELIRRDARAALDAIERASES